MCEVLFCNDSQSVGRTLLYEAFPLLQLVLLVPTVTNAQCYNTDVYAESQCPTICPTVRPHVAEAMKTALNTYTIARVMSKGLYASPTYICVLRVSFHIHNQFATYAHRLLNCY
jgi:hypothetical protein